MKNKICFLIGIFATNVFAFSHLPDKVKTPGHVASTNVQEVCEKDYPKRSRKVTRKTLDEVYSSYSVTKSDCRQGCKVDHLIPLAIGGSNDIKNLWPHEYGAEWTVFEKTRLEVRLRKEVCQNKMDIQKAQTCISLDWTKCYESFYPGQHESREMNLNLNLKGK